ncbi:MAG TPA: branched-chain-amino-acid transaminase [Anaerohalosphaeraceae bacterium]|nr:branched-chain-amino-acid transaminase [Phycisphaerae bacterium]HOK96135.1 branched-chain-amino-acid transaminase [Anaerohalosphaeraceae bacterium]HOL30369.1 branched-chain-amino-acid transaminase [Anaerohalosphaeraceae bacterium]HOM75627.1 branched-chain-amino-acid transaminase [Anaerohalosphaeraceae bacterium]HPC63067.1 branched-chain-amino-acid transaminase [Anaerohalosphaeraceae bacterium]
MGPKIWINNCLVDQAEAKVSVFDHALLYGDGVFEGIRVYGGRIFECKAHLDRLYESAKVIMLKIPMEMEGLTRAMEDTVAANGIREGYIRLIVTRGIGDLGLNPFLCKKAQIIIIADQIQLYPEELYDKGIKVISVSSVRNHPLTCPPQVKSLNYLNNVLAKIEAVQAGADEGIMYNHLGYVAEATGDNVFIVKNGIVYTPPIQAGSLGGITRRVVIRLAKQENINVVETDLTRFDLYVADEMFLTGTAAEVIGVAEMDGRTIGSGNPGPITLRLRKKFFEYAHS